jgi:hypothetical protein
MAEKKDEQAQAQETEEEDKIPEKEIKTLFSPTNIIHNFYSQKKDIV